MEPQAITPKVYLTNDQVEALNAESLNRWNLGHYLKAFGFTTEMSGVPTYYDNWAGVTVNTEDLYTHGHVYVTPNVQGTALKVTTIAELHTAIFMAYFAGYKGEEDEPDFEPIPEVKDGK